MHCENNVNDAKMPTLQIWGGEHKFRFLVSRPICYAAQSHVRREKAVWRGVSASIYRSRKARVGVARDAGDRVGILRRGGGNGSDGTVETTMPRCEE